jgi:hypothetical protein
MAQSYTAETLVASLRRRALIPEAAAEGTLALEDLVALMSEEIQDFIIPEVLALNEEFAVEYYDFTTTPGQTAYAFPPRAVGPKLKDVLVIDPAGGSVYVPIQRIEPGDAPYIQQSASGMTPYCYYLKANSVVFPTDPGAIQVRFQYFLRPNALVLTEAAGLITDIDTGTRQVTIDAAPTSGSFTSSVLYDLVQATPHFALRGMDLEATIAGDVLTFAEDLPDGLAVGDYVCLAGESPIPMIPVGLHTLLAQRTAVKALEALRDVQGVQIAKAMCDESLKRAQANLSPRVEQGTRYVTNRYGPGWGYRGGR